MEEFLKYIAEILGAKPEDLKDEKKAIELAKTFKTNNEITPKEDFDKIKENIRTDVLSSLKAEDVPEKLKKKFTSDLEKLHKEELKKQEETLKQAGNETLLKENAELKATLLKKDEEYATSLEAERGKVTAKLVETEMSSAISVLKSKLDVEPDKLENTVNLLTSAFKSNFKVNLEGDKTFVIGPDGKKVQNKMYEPESLSNVILNFTTQNGFKLREPQQQGRGQEGSTGAGSSPLKGMSKEEWQKSANEKFPMHGSDRDKFYQEYLEANKQ